MWNWLQLRRAGPAGPEKKTRSKENKLDRAALGRFRIAAEASGANLAEGEIDPGHNFRL